MPPETDGQRAEHLAEDFLKQRGLKVLERNYRCRMGEIDLICQEGDTLVFVEVRMRQNNQFGGAAASITARKQQRLVLAARHYLARPGPEPACRFDAVLLARLAPESIEWLKNIITS
jgi:putative endonuclease